MNNISKRRRGLFKVLNVFFAFTMIFNMSFLGVFFVFEDLNAVVTFCSTDVDCDTGYVCNTNVSIPFCVLDCDDTDNDGFCDDSDNCPVISNSGQEDSDGDGAGDACDCAPDDPTKITDCIVPEICDDQIDNDGDDYVDCDDLDCSEANVCKTDTITVKAWKVVCQSEDDLPDWGLSGTQIGEPSKIIETTASDFVNNSDGKCELKPDWEFEWGYSDAVKQDGDFVGKAGSGENWYNFDSMTEGANPAEAIIKIDGSSKLWFREVLKENYVPFVNPPGSVQDSESAEFYCGSDILNFDNYDALTNYSADNEYYCVAFNALKPYCGDNIINQESEECDGTAVEDGYSCDDFCIKHEECKIGAGWAFELIEDETSQGTRKDGSVISANRSDAEAALGTSDTVEGVEGTFFSIGKGGSLAVAFNGYVENVEDSDDLSFHEDTWNDRMAFGNEKVKVYVKKYLSDDWTYLGEVSNHDAIDGVSYLDLDTIDFNWIQYVKLEDSTDFDTEFPTNDVADGYDVDAIDATSIVCEQPADPVCGDGNIDSELGEVCDGSDDVCENGYTCIACQCELIPVTTCEEGQVTLLNPSFEEPVLTKSWDVFSNPFAGWGIEYLSGNSNAKIEIQAGVNGWLSSDGDQHVELDSNESSKISQTVATYPGAVYTLSYDFSPRPGVKDNELDVYVDGILVDSVSKDGTNLSVTDWETLTYSFVAQVGQTEIAFADGSVSDSFGTFLDNIKLELSSCIQYCGDGVVDQDWEECDEGEDTENCRACQIEGDECNDIVLARITQISDNSTGDNSAANNDDYIYLGGIDGKLPNGAWFPVYNEGVYINDLSITEDVPGLAIQRKLGSIRTVLYRGSSENPRYSVGNIEFYNATVGEPENDSNNVLEGDYSDGSGMNSYVVGDDEIRLDNDKVLFWLGVTTGDDGFYTPWTIEEDCEDEPEVTGSIKVCKYEDLNDDGLYDEANDVVVSSWDITIFDGTSSTTDETDGKEGDEGCVVFSDLNLGTYTISEETRDYWTQVFPANINGTIEVTLTENNKDQEFYFLNEYISPKTTICGDGIIQYPNSQGIYEECDSDNVEAGYTCDTSCKKQAKHVSSGGNPGYSGGGAFYLNSGSTKQEKVKVLGEEGAPILTIIKKVNKTIINPGEEIEFEIIIENNGNLPAYNAKLKDILPFGFSYKEDKTAMSILKNLIINEARADEMQKTREWDLGDIVVGETVTKVVRVKANDDLKSGSYSSIVEVSAENHEIISSETSVNVQEVQVLAATGFSLRELMLLISCILILLGLRFVLKQKFA